MKKERSKAIVKDILKSLLVPFLMYGIGFFITLSVFFLYGLNLEPFFYVQLLLLFALIILVAIRSFRIIRHARQLDRIKNAALTEWNSLPPPESLLEADYQDMLSRIGCAMLEQDAATQRKKQDLEDYYTSWVHQIKTPIAVMRLQLGEDTPENHLLLGELFRIEQYVEMVLTYVRLGHGANDLVIQNYSLDALLRESIRKYASQFLLKKLQLSFTPTERYIVTDKKWFSCIIEQLLSNAIKYTPAGTISIFVEGDTLFIRDTGIGIAPEDLPRIFDKGYTGLNGRIGEKSSGLGLYLAKRAAELLSIPLSAESTPMSGSTFMLNLRQQ